MTRNAAARERAWLVAPAVGSAHLTIAADTNPSLREALIAFFVGGAYRIALAPERSFGSEDHWPEAHSMLVQTSASTSEHLRWARGITDLCGGTQLPDKSFAFDADQLERWFASFPREQLLILSRVRRKRRDERLR